MALLTEQRLRSAARQTSAQLRKSYASVLNESMNTEQKEFDIFLSHSIKDAELVLGARTVLIGRGLEVYVDWIDDPKLDRSNVTPETAEKLRVRMRQCKSLLYLWTSGSGASKWIPWELGYFDGYSAGRVAILPVVARKDESYKGQEYLGLYPYVDEEKDNTPECNSRFWVNRHQEEYGKIDDWIADGYEAIKKRPQYLQMK